MADLMPEHCVISALDDEATVDGENVMPRYYFHIHHATSQIDQVGKELPDKEAAWREATSMAAEMLKDAGPRMTPDGSPLRVQIADEFQTPLFELRISGKTIV